MKDREAFVAALAGLFLAYVYARRPAKADELAQAIGDGLRSARDVLRTGGTPVLLVKPEPHVTVEAEPELIEALPDPGFLSFDVPSTFRPVETARPTPTPALAVTAAELRSIYQAEGLRWGVPAELLQAIARIESSENPSAVNPADPSVGLMQVLCPGWPTRCTRKLVGITGWPPADPRQLFDPRYNVSIGAQLLLDNYRRSGPPRSWRTAVAAYQGGEAALKNPGHTALNAEYLRRAERELLRLGRPLW